MFCHIEFLKTFAVKVSNLVRKKTKKKATDQWTKRDKNKLKHFFIFFRASYGFIFRTYIFTFIADIYLFSLLDPSLANVPIPYPPKTPENHMLSGNPRGHKLKTTPAKLDHLLLTHIWPISLFHIPWKLQKTKSPPAFLGGPKPENQQEKSQVTKQK